MQRSEVVLPVNRLIKIRYLLPNGTEFARREFPVHTGINLPVEPRRFGLHEILETGQLAVLAVKFQVFRQGFSEPRFAGTFTMIAREPTAGNAG